MELGDALYFSRGEETELQMGDFLRCCGSCNELFGGLSVGIIRIHLHTLMIVVHAHGWLGGLGFKFKRTEMK